MSEHSEIQWTDHTFNSWSGCEKVSEGCTFCYAGDAPPSMRRFAEWGPGKPRIPATDSYWDQALRWFEAAQKAKVRHRVFAHSMSDVFEDRDDLDPLRDRLLALSQFTRGSREGGLDWLLLTKRLDKAHRYLNDPGLYDRLLRAADWWRNRHPELNSRPIDNPQQSGFHVWYRNVQIGASVENQKAAETRIPWLLKINASVRFLSCEPLLGPLELGDSLGGCRCFVEALEGAGQHAPSCPATRPRIDWVIVGGESGTRRGVRPMHPDWARGVRDQCDRADVPFFFKQWGEYVEVNGPARDPKTGQHTDIDPVKEPERFTNGLSIGIAPNGAVARSVREMRQGVRYRHMHRLGKKHTGRELDGRTHDAFPAPR